MDIEKVIKGLECCTRLGCHHGCEYKSNGYSAMTCRQELEKDVLALLKEQEAVEPTLIREGRNKYYNDYVCPRCDNAVVYEQNYCSECGVRFLWEGR
jgi:hypothetical protein